MILRWLAASFHLLGLGLGLGAVWARAHALRGPLDRPGLAAVFRADTWWGIAALLWVSTGLLRLFMGLEKATAYYLGNHLFWTKMLLFLGVLALEIAPVMTLIKWRMAVRGGTEPDTRRAGRFASTSTIQAILVVLMVLLAAGMARGAGIGTTP